MVSQHHEVTLVPDKDTVKAVRIDWEFNPQSHPKPTHPGVDGLRTSVSKHSEDDLWHLYIMLTDVEAAVRSFKSELPCAQFDHTQTIGPEGTCSSPYWAT